MQPLPRIAAATALALALAACRSDAPSLASAVDLRQLPPPAGFTLVHGAKDVGLGTLEPESSPCYHQDEAPIRVDVDDFCIQRLLVTAAEFCAFLNSDCARKLAPIELFASDEHYHYKASSMECADGVWRPRRGAGQSPADKVTWRGAVEYCEWLTRRDRHGWRYRLPTEAEWEYMARGSTGRPWPWGDAAPTPQRGWRWQSKKWNDAEPWLTCDVGSFPAGATPEGVLDVMGYHLHEWCLNVYREHPTATELTSAACDNTDLVSPRAARGFFHKRKASMSFFEAWMSSEWHEGRVWSRSGCHPVEDPRSSAFGFRIVAARD